jgi:hypothetical protein
MIWVSNCLTLSVPDEGYDFERTWWRLWLWVYLMKVMTLSVPDEGYVFERTWWRVWLWAYLMKVMTLSVPDEGYDFEHTWWRLWLWAYLMKVIQKWVIYTTFIYHLLRFYGCLTLFFYFQQYFIQVSTIMLVSLMKKNKSTCYS